MLQSELAFMSTWCGGGHGCAERLAAHAESRVCVLSWNIGQGVVERVGGR